MFNNAFFIIIHFFLFSYPFYFVGSWSFSASGWGNLERIFHLHPRRPGRRTILEKTNLQNNRSIRRTHSRLFQNPRLFAAARVDYGRLFNPVLFCQFEDLFLSQKHIRANVNSVGTLKLRYLPVRAYIKVNVRVPYVCARFSEPHLGCYFQCFECLFKPFFASCDTKFEG